VGVGIAGQCDLSAGVVRRGPNLFWPDVPFRDLLAERLGVPVVLRNDVVMATAGEWRQGAGRGASDLVCLFVGTGIGGGAVAGGRLVDGSSGLAGHFGHISVDLNGPRCTCGRTGCVEAYAGGDNVAAQVRRELSRDRERSPVLMEMCGGDLEVLSSRMVAQAVSKGDAYSVSVRDRMAAALSSAVASVINSFNPGTVVLGGTVLFGFPGLADMVITGATEQCLGPARRGLSIVPSALGDLAGAIGAAAMALETYG
jgi:glucokinase